MAETNDALESLDGLIDALNEIAAPAAPAEDAIDRVLAGAPRRTAVQSLRDDPVMQRFRQDLSNGLIRLDTANVVFRLIAQVLRSAAGGGGMGGSA